MPSKQYRKYTKMHTAHEDDVRHGCLADRWEEGFWHAGKLDPNEYSPETLRVLANYEGVCTRMCGLSWIRAKASGIYGRFTRPS